MTQTAQPTDKPTAVATIEEGSIADQVLHRVTTMEAANELTLPDGYHVGNALKSAWLYLQSIKDKADRPATQTCTRASIANCLLEMVIRGEHPMHHCYFIPTGNQLTFWEKYTGKLMRAKRDTDIQAVNAQVVYKGDEFTYTVDEDGRYQLVAHKTSIQNMTPANIVAAYAVVIMRDGFIQQIGTPQEVFDHPANLFVAGFIGTPQMNFFDARLIKQNGRYAVTLDGITVELADDKQARLSAKDVPEQDIVLGVRPDHIVLCADGVKGNVDVSELMGSSVHLHISTNGHDVVVIVPTNGNAAHFPMGSEVNMIFGGNVAHVFSKETEKNLEW